LGGVILAVLAVLVVQGHTQTPGRLDFLLSGHSLTDSPIDEFTASIATSKGLSSEWQKQNMVGSPLFSRTLGHRNDPYNPTDHPWIGYRSGNGRNGVINLITELRQPSGRGFTHLVVAERHDSLGPLQWENTVKLLRHFYELAREGSPEVKGYFYTTWADVKGTDSSHDDPTGWIRHEREQQKLWECITARINDSLAHENRLDRMATLPASGALAELVERATTGTVAGVTAADKATTMRRIFSDDVHLTRLGQYYVACVVFGSLSRTSPAGGWHPEEIDPATAKVLQEFAWSYVSDYFKDHPNGPQPNAEERLSIAGNFAETFWTYRGRPEQAEGGRRFFSQASPENPLWFSAGIDESGYWFPKLP
jgi:hypothetical protein